MTSHESIASVDPEVWDSLADPDDLQSTHRFVAACEASRIEDASYRHVIVWPGTPEAAPEPMAVATLCTMTVSLDVLAHPWLRRVLSLPRRVWPGFLRVPVVFCGLPVSFGRPCLRMRPGADRAGVLRAVMREMAAFAARSRAPLLCFKEFSDEETRDFGALEDAGYVRLPSLPACRLRLPWRRFADYLDSLRASYRRQILSDRRAGARRGQRIRLVEDFSRECPALFALYGQVIDRARHRLERLNPAFLRQINDAMGAASRALLLESEGRVLASAILLYTPRTVTFLLAGIDYECNREHHAYPNLVAAVVEEAIRVGAESLELGQTSYALKTRLGGIPERRWIYLRATRTFLHGALRTASPALFPATSMPARRVFRDHEI